MRIIDWSSDVCSSDLHGEDREAEYRMQEDAIERIVDARGALRHRHGRSQQLTNCDMQIGVGRNGSGWRGEILLIELCDQLGGAIAAYGNRFDHRNAEIGRASCRERVCQYV